MDDELEFAMYPMETATIECTATTDEEGNLDITLKGMDKVTTYGQLIELNTAVLTANQLILAKLRQFHIENNTDPSWSLEQINMLAANTSYDEES